MFLKKLLTQNPQLADYALFCHKKGTLLPDTYLLDADAIRDNAELILREADKYNIKLYFMLKQIGRIAGIGKILCDIGYQGAVCVDFREALSMIERNIPVGHAGHLGQIPTAALERVLDSKPGIITVYSVEKAKLIGEFCLRRGYVQDVMLRVFGDETDLYPGQHGGFRTDELEHVAKQIEELPGVRIAGVCSFPCIQFNTDLNLFEPTPNLFSVNQAAEILRKRGHGSLQINLPSCTCVNSMGLIAQYGATHAEPGHGLTGTTPYHAHNDSGTERIAVAYLSEVSHNLGNKGYCYGGGWYRRSGLTNALVGGTVETAEIVRAFGPPPESIDYYLELDSSARIGSPVLMSFRTQIFVTRSKVAVIRGLSDGRPEITGIYSALGE